MEYGLPDEVPAEAGSPGRSRAAPRDSLFLQATLCRIGEREAKTVRVRNLSPGGLMAEIGEPFREGDRLSIELRGLGVLDGVVIWRADDRIGVAFATPIDPRRARKAVARRPGPALVAPRTVNPPKLFG